MEREKVIEQIKKLLALASSPNENEAKLAMSKAQELMQKYSVNIFEQTNEAERQIIEFRYETSIRAGSGIYNELPLIVQTIGRIFGCQLLVGYPNVPVLYGFPTNIEIARYAIDSILAQAAIDYRKEYKKYKTTTFSETFWRGFRSALFVRFSQIQKQTEGLVVYDKVKDYVNERSKGLWNHSGNSELRFGLEAGTKSAQSVEIRKGVQATQKGNLLNASSGNKS